MTSSPLTSEQILTIIAATPTHIAALTSRLAPAQLQTPVKPDEWSLNEVLAHMRACNDVWGSNMKTIISQDRPTLRGINPRVWIKKTTYLELEFRPSLQAFTGQRLELLEMLEPLSPEGWSRVAFTIDMVGKKFERTLLFYADKLARHERTHVRQIERIVKRIQR